jgi:hypothetical protein
MLYVSPREVLGEPRKRAHLAVLRALREDGYFADEVPNPLGSEDIVAVGRDVRVILVTWALAPAMPPFLSQREVAHLLRRARDARCSAWEARVQLTTAGRATSIQWYPLTDSSGRRLAA